MSSPLLNDLDSTFGPNPSTNLEHIHASGGKEHLLIINQ